MYHVFSYDYESDIEKEVFSDIHFDVCKDVKEDMLMDLKLNDALYGPDGKARITFTIRTDDGVTVS